ncbi:hypothetical protein HPT25_22090 [Bacillus sp. BRMEA1]|uniref:hypothetical protein n=1 Tax=Neobacillus endophyticus TaxID=2738405 RepID=UPI0015665A08|nr:hypothetical protein [Neobacillus endophyticus]NRD80031.1 hypothetical protein [Neobacillus endophyticus]
MASTIFKRCMLVLFTFGFFGSSYIEFQHYLKYSKPTDYPAVSDVQLQKQTTSVKEQVQKMQSSLAEEMKVQASTNNQYANLISKKNTLTTKVKNMHSSQKNN